MAADLGLTISLFQPFRDFEAMPEPQRARNLDRAERKFDTMKELGAELMLVCSSVPPVALGELDAPPRTAGARRARRGGAAFASATRRWPGAATSTGLRACLGHRAPRRPSRARPHPGQLPHAVLRRRPAGRSPTVPGENIFFVQMADAPKLDIDLLSWSRHFR